MRAFFATVLAGAVLGLGFGFGIGAFQTHLTAWSIDREINRGTVIAESIAEREAEKAQKPDSMKKPTVKVEETSFDFGILEKNPSTEKGEHPFYIENVGDADMTLADGGKGCFCTSFTISKQTLKPGEKATILFKWDGARAGGIFSQGIRVLTNDPDKKEVSFVVRGLYTAPIICDPNEIAFQNASSTVEQTRTFRILGFEKNDDGTPFPLEILSAEPSDPEHFVVEIEPADLSELTEQDKTDRLNSQTTSLFKGSVALKTGMPQGAFQELIRFRTNSPRTPILETTVRGQIASKAIKITGALFDEKNTGQLQIDSVEQAKGMSTSLRMLINDKLPANAETVQVKSVRPDWLKVEMTYPDEELQKVSPIRLIDIVVSIPPGSPEGAFSGPDPEKLGEIVFSVGMEDSKQDVVIPVRFAVGQ